MHLLMRRLRTMKNKLIFIISLFALTSCGTKVSMLGNYGLDHSANWKDNYYTYFDEKLSKLDVEEHILDVDDNKVFTSFKDDNFIALEERATGDNAYSYEMDFDPDIGFGSNMKLSKDNEKVKEGVASKLFDGQMFCYGYFEAARVQINENGFTSSFGKALVSSDYLYLNFKSALNFKSNDIEAHEDDVTLHITFYSNEKGIRYSYSLTDVVTNYSESSKAYTFFGFSTKDLDLNNATSFAISYTLDKESYNEENDLDIDHALLLYEFGFKNPVFK